MTVMQTHILLPLSYSHCSHIVIIILQFLILDLKLNKVELENRLKRNHNLTPQRPIKTQSYSFVSTVEHRGFFEALFFTKM